MISELGENLIPVMAIGCAFLFVTIWVIAATVDSIIKALINSRLKMRMIERNYSASEIERVLNAGISVEAEGTDASTRPSPPVKAGPAY